MTLILTLLLTLTLIQDWLLPLVSPDSPWLLAEAFGGAEAVEAANTTNTTAADDESSTNSISIGAFVTLLG